MQQIYTDKEILNDGLCAQKACTGKFNMAATECVHSSVRGRESSSRMWLEIRTVICLSRFSFKISSRISTIRK